ncbi:MAG: ArsR/SmtB family transcription factor [Vicinamibacterales bacterium]
MNEAASLLRLLGDEARLRILRLLAVERLNVSEMTGVLGLAQSGVSRHLGLLKDAGLIGETREGGYTYYRVIRHADSLAGQLWPWLQTQLDADTGETARADAAKLAEVVRLRKERFQSDLPEQRQLMPGRSWAAWARALGHLLPAWRVADVGCGEGYLSVEAASWAAHVTAVDRSPEALALARGLAARRGVDNITWQRGELERLPLSDGSHDVVLVSQALHHAQEPARALAEAARVTAPGGRVLVLDLKTHEQAWVREQLGDRWLGFDEDDLRTWLERAGLEDVRVGVGARLRGDPFTVIIASGRKPETSSSPSPRRGARESRRTA